MLAVRWALRDLRGGVRGLRLFLACLVLGVAAIAAVGSVNLSIVEGLRKNAREMVGGDVAIRQSNVPLEAEALAWIEERTDKVSKLITMRGMSRTMDGEKASLVSLKSVDDAYPMVGSLVFEPAMDMAEATAIKDGVIGAAVDPLLAARLGIGVGDHFRIGDAELRLATIIKREPDRNANMMSFGPRVLVSEEGLAATGLVQPGSVMRYHYRLVLGNAAQTGAFVDEISAAFPDAWWYLRDARNADERMKEFLDRFSVYLTLTGLTALVIGGIGIAGAIRHHLDSKTATIATLKALGAPANLITRIWLMQILVLTALGLAIGSGLGAIVPFVLPSLVDDQLASIAMPGIYPLALLNAGAYGLLVALLFTLWPLARARDIPAAHLYRDLVSPDRIWPRKSFLFAMAACLVGILALAMGQGSNVPFTRQTIGGLLGVLLLFWLLGQAFRLVAGKLRQGRGPVMRLALSNISRPGAPTAAVTMSIGIGLTVLVAVAQIEGNLQNQVKEQIPDKAPSYMFIDIRKSQADQFDSLVKDAAPSASFDRERVLTGRLLKIGDVPVAEAEINPRSNWLRRNDLFLGLRSTPPEGLELAAGEWWPEDYKGPLGISLAQEIATNIGVGIGDTLTFVILGREMTAEILNLRKVNWRDMSLNFTVIFAPGILDRAPYQNVSAVYVDPDEEEQMFQAVTKTLPNVTALRLRDVMDTVAGMIQRMAVAVRSTAGLTLASGVLVLAGAVAAGQRKRIYESVVLKTLGAERRIIQSANLIEFAILGLSTAALAALVGSAAAAATVKFVMRVDYLFVPVETLIAISLGLGLILATGWLSNRAILRQPAMGVLRSA